MCLLRSAKVLEFASVGFSFAMVGRIAATVQMKIVKRRIHVQNKLSDADLRCQQCASLKQVDVTIM